jgi:hypothetical protein
MKRVVLVLAAVVCCFSLPLADKSQSVSVVDELQTQALVALQKSDAPGKYKNFIPLVNQLVVYTGAVLPSVRAKKEKLHMSEITESLLVQTMDDAAGLKSDLEKSLPTGESIMDAMIALGNVMGGSSGYNPVTMMANVIGKDDMGHMIDELMKFPLHFPDPDDKQLMAAEQVVLSVGLGFGDQNYAIDNFIHSLSDEQTAMIESLEKNVINKTISSMTTEGGDPSPALIEEIKRQMREMEKTKGSTEMMPEEFKDLVKTAHTQALVAIQADTVAATKFKNFLPLVNQVVVYTTTVLPGIKSSKEHQKNQDLSAGMLVQTVSEAAGVPESDMAKIEKWLPTSDDMLDATIKIGRVMAGKDGFNPVQMMTNIVGSSDMKTAIDDMMHFPLRFPDLTDQQLMAAESVVLSVGLGFGDQQYAIDNFMKALDQTQRSMLEKLQTDIMEKLVGSMVLPNGEPSPKLLEEIKKEMREMEKATGNTDQMPSDLKDLVKGHGIDDVTQIQALVAINGGAPQADFENLLPLVRQVVVYSGAVLPGIRAKKDKHHNSELTDSVLVQTMADAAGSRPSEMSDLEKALPTSDDMLTAMEAIGNVMGGSSGFNPIKLLSNVVGKSNMSRAISDVMLFPLHFPDLTDDQLMVAEEVALSAGLGFMNQEQAVDRFIGALSPEQKTMLDTLQKEVFDTMLDAMVAKDGKPTPALVEEIKSQMREMQKRKGSTDMMPDEIKNIVSDAATPAQ